MNFIIYPVIHFISDSDFILFYIIFSIYLTRIEY